MKIFNKIKNKIKLIQSKVKGKRYVYLQKPVKEMSYEEAVKEFSKKEKIVYTQENSLTGRNSELIKKVVFESKDNNYAIKYLIKLCNNENISKNVKLDFIYKFCCFFDDNELCKILSISEDDINNQFKVQIVKHLPNRVPEEFIIQYFDYTDIELDYVEKMIENISVDGKIKILNQINNDDIKEKLLLKEVNNLDFDDAKKMYEEVILYGYNEIEEFYIKKIKTMGGEEALLLLNQMSYISPKLAKAFDRVIKSKSVEEVIDYINNNKIKKGGIIYLCRKFSVKNKKEIFYGLKDEENRKNALVIFSSDLGKKDFISMVNEEKNEEIKAKMIDNANFFMRTKVFSEEEIGKMKE